MIQQHAWRNVRVVLGVMTILTSAVYALPPVTNDLLIALDGTDVTDWPLFQRARRGLGYLPQDDSVFGKLTVPGRTLDSLRLGRGSGFLHAEGNL